MKELIRFSLKRRFANKAQLFINLIIFCATGCVLFADALIDTFMPSLLQPIEIMSVSLPKDMIQTLNEEESSFHFKLSKSSLTETKKKHEIVLVYDGEYTLHIDYPMDAMKFMELETMIDAYHKKQILSENEDSVELLAYVNPITLKQKTRQKGGQDEKENIVFLIITGIYFMILSFATAVANEVVYEKSTKTLELILTSVSAKTHFLSKLLSGWLTILLQCTITGGCFLFWIFIRWQIDGGSHLISIVKQLHIISIKEQNFSQLISHLAIDFDFFMKLCGIFLFLFIGMLFLQMILVVISSFISNIEAASSIQAPFYMILVAVYYLTLSLNNPEQMSQGLGYYLSFLPFFSMLMMPCRLLLTTVTLPEFLLALGFACVSLWSVLYYGGAIYQKGVLEYSNKGLIQIIRSMFSKGSING